MARKATVFALFLVAILSVHGTIDDGKTSMFSVADFTGRQHELLIGSKELNQYTGDGG